MVTADARLSNDDAVRTPDSGDPALASPALGDAEPQAARTGASGAWWDRLARGAVERVLARIDVRIDGGRPWDIRVLDERFFRRAILQGSMGLGEAYMDGWWQCGDLEELSRRFLASDLEDRFAFLPSYVAPRLAARLTNQQDVARSRRVADVHYSMDNDLFSRFLGRYKMYSAGYFEALGGGGGPVDLTDLDAAQARKLELICRKLQLKASDHLLDVGGGWGELARYAASTYGCRVTSINISDEQIRFARDYCQGLPVEVRKCDYRDLEGRYDKIASIAMVAHVGHKNHRTFMQKMHDHLAPEGLMLVESTGNNVSRIQVDPWVDRYIFMGATFPSMSQLTAAAEGLFAIDDWQNFGASYPPTLRQWNANFQRDWPALRARYQEPTRRMFEYFFLMGAGAFHARILEYWHLVMAPLSRRERAGSVR
jgi:cyclopropane-fatty-acyl-phospholipid synthase